WNVTVLSLFPELFPGPLEYSLAGKAMSGNIWKLNAVNLRDYAPGKHKTLDDKPFGGGTGMVLNPVVIGDAIEDITAKNKIEEIIYLSPRGKVYNQTLAEELIQKSHILFLCGRFEGVDQRVIDHYKIREISLGDFILSGGELAALSIIDSCVRLLPNVIGKESALDEESFSSKSIYQNLLEYPHYTRPASWKGHEVPEVLLTGHHKNIEKWRLEEAEKITKKRRKDLWRRYLK
ncbi:unnamed protein product, partial [Sphagnum compactum]